MNSEQKHWLLRKSTIRKLWIALYVSLAICVLLELLVTHHHAYFGVDGSFGFSAWFGFLACLLMVIFAKLLGIFIKRPDSYYQQQTEQHSRSDTNA